MKTQDAIAYFVIVVMFTTTYFAHVRQKDSRSLIDAMVDAQIEREASKFCAPVEKLVREMSRCSLAEGRD